MSLIEPLAWGSSKVDWCEANYEITRFVAEFYNTISNALFFVFPPLLIYLFRQYAQQVTWGVNLVWIMLIVVGAGSVYFHATLSLVGQLVDEIAIIWVFMVAMALWWPKSLMPQFLQQSRPNFQKMALLFTVVSTGLACLVPELNYILLFVLGVPSTYLLVTDLRSCKSERAYRLGIQCCMVWLTALASWINDRVFCNLWAELGFPYLHCFWHIFIAIASYTACVLFAYFNALEEVPEQMPVLQYWPKDSWTYFGIPYVKLKCVGAKPTYKNY